jgi:hypothetical protein
VAAGSYRARRHGSGFVLTLGRFEARIFTIFAIPVMPGFVTAIVSVVPTFSAFFRYAVSATVPPFWLTIVTDFFLALMK